jgi:hypothetical protein
MNNCFFFRLAIIRIALLFLDLFLSFTGHISLLLINSLDNTHHADKILMWLCERDSLWFVMEYTFFAATLIFANGIWILLFVVTGPQFSEGFKNA